jgi:hypothetical protein
MMLVDGWLAKKGAQTGCSREDVRAAFDFLTSPLTNRAIYIDDVKRAAIITASA